MSKDDFELCGRIVTHTARPRFTMIFRPHPDGGWEGDHTEWIDQPILPGMSSEALARVLARLSREAGDFFAAYVRRDWLQEAVIARSEKLGLTSYEIAKKTGGAVSEDHVRAYLTRNKSMGSHKIQHVLRVLGFALIVPDK